MKLLFWQYCLHFSIRLILKGQNVCTSADEREEVVDCLPVGDAW